MPTPLSYAAADEADARADALGGWAAIVGGGLVVAATAVGWQLLLPYISGSFGQGVGGVGSILHSVSPSGAAVLGAVLLVFGGIGLLRGRPWARAVAGGTAAVGLLYGIAGLVSTVLFWGMSSTSVANGVFFIGLSAQIVGSAVVLWRVLRPPLRAAARAQGRLPVAAAALVIGGGLWAAIVAAGCVGALLVLWDGGTQMTAGWEWILATYAASGWAAAAASGLTWRRWRAGPALAAVAAVAFGALNVYLALQQQWPAGLPAAERQAFAATAVVRPALLAAGVVAVSVWAYIALARQSHRQTVQRRR